MVRDDGRAAYLAGRSSPLADCTAWQDQSRAEKVPTVSPIRTLKREQSFNYMNMSVGGHRSSYST